MMGNSLHKNRRGFTLVETLLVIAVLVILLAVSAVGVAVYLRQAQVTELDNAAREIYLAAQNRAILLQGSQRLRAPWSARTTAWTSWRWIPPPTGAPRSPSTTSTAARR